MWAAPFFYLLTGHLGWESHFKCLICDSALGTWVDAYAPVSICVTRVARFEISQALDVLTPFPSVSGIHVQKVSGYFYHSPSLSPL